MVLYVLVALLVLLVVLPLVGVAFWMLISMIVSGLVVGALGRLVVPGSQPIGLVMTALVGIGGSVIGTLLGRALSVGGFLTLLLQVGMAAVLVAVAAGRSRRSVSGYDRTQLTRRGY